MLLVGRSDFNLINMVKDSKNFSLRPIKQSFHVRLDYLVKSSKYSFPVG